MVVIGITKQCPLSCQHCYEWKNLNQEETLLEKDILAIIQRLQEIGIAQIQLSGGEPLKRYNTILKILDSNTAPTEYWLLTSGMGLTGEKARELKDRGLTGVNVSIDHHDPDSHNHFRGHPDSFHHAVIAVLHSLNAGLLTCMTLCPTPEYITEKNLFEYLDLAKILGVPMIQILEPRNSGRWKNRKVELGPPEIEILESFYLKANFSGKYKEGPIISYHGYNQRRNGCFASGNRFFYIDTNGHAHSCPFCQDAIVQF